MQTWLTVQMEPVDFAERMQKFGGWIANITECADFQMDAIEQEKPYTQVIAPIEASQTLQELWNALSAAKTEMVDRLASPLVDVLCKAHHCFVDEKIYRFDERVTAFMTRVCASGNMEAFNFCLQRCPGNVWDQGNTLSSCLATAIVHNSMAIAKWLVTVKGKFDKGEFVVLLFSMSPYRSIRVNLQFAVQNLIQQGGLEMILWMTQYMSPHEVMHYMLHAALEVDAVDVVRELYSLTKTVVESLGKKFGIPEIIVKYNAVRCARMFHEIGVALFADDPDCYVKNACKDSDHMPMFLYLVEELKLPFHRIETLKYLGGMYLPEDEERPQLEYLLTHSTLTDHEKEDVIQDLLENDALHRMLWKFLEHGFRTPRFPSIFAPYAYLKLRYVPVEPFLKYLDLGVPCDENTMCAAIHDPQKASIVFSRSGEHVLTRRVWDNMIAHSSRIDPTIWNWFASRGFVIDEDTLAKAHDCILDWCLEHRPPGLTGSAAFYQCAQELAYVRGRQLILAGLKPSKEHIRCAKGQLSNYPRRIEPHYVDRIVKLFEDNVQVL